MVLEPYDARFDLPYEQEYPHTYSGLRVLDVGADWGSTTEYFLCHGAKQVIAVEGSMDYYPKLEANFKNDSRVVPVFIHVDSVNEWNMLLDKFEVDLVKSDCEGCEKHLVTVPDANLMKVPVWIIEVHDDNVFFELCKRFWDNQFRIDVLVWRNASIGKTVTIFKASR